MTRQQAKHLDFFILYHKPRKVPNEILIFTEIYEQTKKIQFLNNFSSVLEQSIAFMEKKDYNSLKETETVFRCFKTIDEFLGAVLYSRQANPTV